MTEDLLSPRRSGDEDRVEASLRPQSLSDFVGQGKLKENLSVFISAAKGRSEPLDHCLFYSPPGLGKTTLANILAKELGVSLKATAGPVLEKVGDLAAMLTDLSEGDVFFIDEIHRLNRAVEEALYPVMEDFTFYINTGRGPAAATVKLAIPRFTLVGATTRAGLLTGPLRDRFGIVGHLEFYGLDELVSIVGRSARILGAKAEPEGIREIARRSRGTPRIANRLLRRVRDFADVRSGGLLGPGIAREALDALEVDDAGLDKMDRRLLEALVSKFEGGPVGAETLAIAVSEETDTLTDVYEPFLIKAGFLKRTPRGRLATPRAYEHLGLPLPKRSDELF